MSDKTLQFEALTDFSRPQISRPKLPQRSASLPNAFDERIYTATRSFAHELFSGKRERSERPKEFIVQRRRIQSLFCENKVKTPLFVGRYRPAIPGEKVFEKPSLADIRIKNEHVSVEKKAAKTTKSRPVSGDQASASEPSDQLKLPATEESAELGDLHLNVDVSAVEKSRSPMATFAKDDKHFHYIMKSIKRTAVEVPIPLQKLILEEASQIIELTAKDYDKLFGSSDHLTVEAKKKLEDTTNILGMWALLKF